MSTEFDIEIAALQQAVPKKCKGMITKEFVDNLNGLVTDQTAREAFRDNLFGYTDILKDGNLSMKAYVNAVKYVTYKLFDNTNLAAYVKTFPDRYQDMLNKNYPEKDINSVISGYNKGRIVTKLFELTMTPSHIINADLHQKAINHLAYLMLNARSEKVQSDSASKLVDALKMPETAKVELEVKVGQDSAIDDLRRSTLELVKQQKLVIEAGAMSAKEIAHSSIIDSTAEVIEVG